MSTHPFTDVRSIVFDVGETLVDETRMWSELAAAAGVTPFTLMAALGSIIERGGDHREVWRLLGVERPVLDVQIDTVDLYPDALACLAGMRDAGFLIGVAGNQPEGVGVQLRTAGFAPDFIASSAAWGVSKPSSAFFARVTLAAGVPASAILYVGDRLDNDVLPARAAGMRTALIRRGPWAAIQSRCPEAALADVTVDSLDELRRAVGLSRTGLC